MGTPSRAPHPPPELKIPPQHSSLKTRKLPGFIMKNEAKRVKKVVRFEDEAHLSDSLELIPEESGAVMETDDEAHESLDGWVEPEGESSEDEDQKARLKLELMYDVFRNLNQECEERKRGVRIDSGEIIEGKTPPSSQDSNASWEFNLASSSATDEVDAGEIFDFIWKYISDHNQDIYRRIGTGNITRKMAEDYLRSAPSDLLQILEVALVEAEKKVNHFSV
jgi:hypothetical protein